MSALVTADSAAPHFHQPRSSVSSSVSSSAATVKRSASLTSSPNFATRPSTAPYRPPSPADAPSSFGKLQKKRPAHSRRSSSITHIPSDAIGSITEDAGDSSRWSPSPTANKSPKGKGRRGFARRLSLGGDLFNGPLVSPKSPRKGPTLKKGQPEKSPRLRSPAPVTPRTLAPLPPIDSVPALPTTLLDDASASTANTAGSSASGLLTNSSFGSSTDYFSAKTQNSDSANGSRTKVSRAQTPQSLKKTPGSPPTASPSRARVAKEEETSSPAGHHRPRRKASHTRSGSESSNHSRAGSGDHGRTRREKDKKTMLSRALAKANTAVLLDNAQNFEGAIEAYSDACKLLQAVMLKSSGEDDRRKLDAIRQTYTNRINELQDLDVEYPPSEDKSLPARPMSDDSIATVSQSIFNGEDDEEPAVIQTATMTRIVNDRSIDSQIVEERPGQQPVQDPELAPSAQRDSVLSSVIRDMEFSIQNPEGESTFLASPESTAGNRLIERSISYEAPMDRSYMPQPLTPRRIPSPFSESDPQSTERLRPLDSRGAEHSRENGNGSVSWLDTIDESGGSSCSASVRSHSVSSQDPGMRTHLRTDSGDTDAGFDAALDAAVESAYDEGFEPFEFNENGRKRDTIIEARLKIDLAKERVREVEREEAIRAAKLREQQRMLERVQSPYVWDPADLSSPGNESAEEEERILDEMTKEYMLDGFDFGLQSKSALPRGSDSSSYSGATWNSSMSSTRGTAATLLSPVTEDGDATAPAIVSARFVRPPVPTAPAPPPPDNDSTSADAGSEKTLPQAPAVHGSQSQTIRSRRISGQPSRQLRIETSTSVNTSPSRSRQQTSEHSPTPRSATSSRFEASMKDLFNKADGRRPSLSSFASSRHPTPSPSDVSVPAAPSVAQLTSSENGRPPQSSGGSRFPGKLGPPPTTLKKNKSSLSLKSRNLSVSSPNASDGSVNTPMSATFGYPAKSGLLNGLSLAFQPSLSVLTVEALPLSGRRLFDNAIHSSDHPGKPNSQHPEAPLPLEPCPDSHLLRPFWLMRSLYQTIAQPRGAYITNKLFIPRDIWWVRGVKIKNVDDKISNCDLLTAALLKLGNADSLDADAMLEEMQSLETMLDQVQANLTKKLGNDVGVQSISNLFKDAAIQNQVDAVPGAEPPKSAGGRSTSYLTSWRRLRSKNSGTGLSKTFALSQDMPKEALMMSSLPMTSLPNIRFAKRDVGRLDFSGPHGMYMSSLARLFDAVQVVDQIARQVEDPGLKYSSSTHVGLELSTRHASEFFGFYICRFVLQDVTTLLDKYIKRSSEWVFL